MASTERRGRARPARRPGAAHPSARHGTRPPRPASGRGVAHRVPQRVAVHRPARPHPGGVGATLHGIAGEVGGIAKDLGAIFGGVAPGHLGSYLTNAFIKGFFHSLVAWVAGGAAALLGQLGRAMSSSTAPVVSGRAWDREFAVMAVLGAAVALPLLFVAAITAIARQEPGDLLRAALVRLPLALLGTGVCVQLVALGLAATDQASDAVLHTAGDPTEHLLAGLVGALVRLGGAHAAGFGMLLVALAAAAVAFVLWLELAVRSAAIAAATLFLPLALAGLAWPSTAHWARRLGETLAALVVAKLVIAAVLALAAGLLGSSSGVAGVVEGVALLAVAAGAPFVLLRLVPAVEAGAVAHLEGTARRPVGAAQRAWSVAGMAAGGLGGAAMLDEAGPAASPSGAAGAGGAGARPGASAGTGPGGGPGAGEAALRILGAGPFGRSGDGDGAGGFGDRVARWDELLAEQERARAGAPEQQRGTPDEVLPGG